MSMEMPKASKLTSIRKIVKKLKSKWKIDHKTLQNTSALMKKAKKPAANTPTKLLRKIKERC